MQALETAAALELAGLSRAVWNDALARNLYTEAPATTQGKPRFFDRDDLVGLFTMDHYTRLGIPPRIAALVASAVRKYLRRKTAQDIEELYIITTKAGVPHRVTATKPEALWHHAIPVRQLRSRITILIAERVHRQ